MLSKSEFREEHDNDFGGRPQRIQRLRPEFDAYVDYRPPRSASAVMDWYANHKSEITKRLNDDGDADIDGGDGDETEGGGD